MNVTTRVAVPGRRMLQAAILLAALATAAFTALSQAPPARAQSPPTIIPLWPDLFVTDARIVDRPGPGRGGGTRPYFEFTVRNGGLLPAGPFTIRVSMSGFQERTITVVVLLPGQSQTFRELTERPEPGGCRTYDVFVDSARTVVELNESNNLESISLCGAVPAG